MEEIMPMIHESSHIIPIASLTPHLLMSLLFDEDLAVPEERQAILQELPEMVVSNSWRVYFRENTIEIRMMSGGYPHDLGNHHIAAL